MNDILYLNQDDLLELGIDDMVFAKEVMREVFKEHARRNFVQPSSVFLRRSENDHVANRIICMPAFLEGKFCIEGIKWIGSSPLNHAKGLPRASALIILNDPNTHLPVAIMDGTIISAVRTAAVQALAREYLGMRRPTSIGLVGAGRIGALIMYALSCTTPSLETFMHFDIDVHRAKKFTVHMAKLGIQSHSAQDYHQALGDADIGIAATTAGAGFLPPEVLKEGGLFLNVSLMDPTPELVLSADKIVVDDWVQCNKAGRVLNRMYVQGLITEESIHGELGEIVLGNKVGRENSHERIFWNPMGMAIEDLGLAYRMWRRALEDDVGKRMRMWKNEWTALL